MLGEVKSDVGFRRVIEVCSRRCRELIVQLRRQSADGVSVMGVRWVVAQLTINMHSSGRFAVCKTACNVQYDDNASEQCATASMSVCRHDRLLCRSCPLVSRAFRRHRCKIRAMITVAVI
jgi:hypothetical protein